MTGGGGESYSGVERRQELTERESVEFLIKSVSEIINVREDFVKEQLAEDKEVKKFFERTIEVGKEENQDSQNEETDELKRSIPENLPKVSLFCMTEEPQIKETALNILDRELVLKKSHIEVYRSF